MPEITHTFRAVTRDCRIHSGPGAIGALGAELKRRGAARALVLTGNSIATRTDLPDRLRAAGDGRVAEVFPGIGKDTPLPDVEAAAALARGIGADALVALGGGSVIQAARVTAIFLAEDGRPEDLSTQYPEDGPAISPRLMAPKLPIINVPTIGTTAQDRGGSPVKWPGGPRRLEYFDPKTRPAALIWDEAALATAPLSMVRATAAMMRWRAVLDMGYAAAPILVDLSRRQILEITGRIMQALAAGEDTAALRADLCVATWLHNRQADDGGRAVNTWASRTDYAFSTALFHRHEEVAQGAAVTALGVPLLRSMGPRDPGPMAAIAAALGLASDPEAVADRLAAEFEAAGMPVNLTQLGVPKESHGPVLEGALTNFNADPKREFLAHREALSEALSACW